MPRLTFPVAATGLTVPVLVGLNRTSARKLHASGQPIPAPVQARGEIDTAANPTAVAPWILQKLGVRAGTSATTQTAGGPVRVKLFKVSLSVIDPNRPGSPMLTYPDIRVSELATTLPDADVLIGLDLLLDIKFLLDGPARTFTLDF